MNARLVRRFGIVSVGTLAGWVVGAVLAAPALAQVAPCGAPAWANLCVPGSTSSVSCAVEWEVDAPPIFDSRGMRRNRVVCYEGDPRCDVDPNLNNNRCTIRVAPCVNNVDPRLPRCTPSSVDTFSLYGRLNADNVDDANRAALEGVMGAGGLGLSVFRNATANRGIPMTVYAGTPNATLNECAAPVDVLVPMVQRGQRVRKGMKRLRMRTTTASGRADSDTLIFECRPSTCGDGVIQPAYEQCDDGNRDNGDGCDQGCQLEGNEAPDLPTPLPTRTPTPDPNAPTLTPTATASPTPTEVFVTRRCNFQTGTNNTGLTVAGNVTANSNVSGFQDWQFFPIDENGLGEIRVPATGPSPTMSFSCAQVSVSLLITINAATVCIRPDIAAGDGIGVIDCNGGTEFGYNSQTIADHNTNQNAVGLPQDPDCEEVYVTPDGLVSNASIETPGDVYHAGVCNSALNLTYNGTYPANGMTITQKLIARISADQTSCSPNPCPDQDAPFDSSAGDLAVTGKMTTGQSVAILHNRNNNQTATNFNRTFTGTAGSCAQIYTAPTNNLTNIRLGVIIPFPDAAATINDALVEVRLRCQ